MNVPLICRLIIWLMICLVAARPSMGQTARSHSDFQGTPTELIAHSDAVYGIAFSPDSQVLASGSYDKTVKLWNVADAEVIATLTGHTDQVFRVTFSPDGKTLASCSGDSTAIIWDVDKRQKQVIVEGHGDPMMDVAYSPDGDLIATSGNHIQLWNQDREVWSTPHTEPFFSLAFSPVQKWLACGTANSVRIMDFHNSETLPHEIEVRGMVYQVQFSPDGKWLALAAGEQLSVWDVERQDIVHATKADASALFAAVFSADGKRIVTGGRERVVRVWSVPELQPLTELYGPQETVLAIDVSPDGKRIACGSYDGKIHLWSIAE